LQWESLIQSDREYGIISPPDRGWAGWSQRASWSDHLLGIGISFLQFRSVNQLTNSRPPFMSQASVLSQGSTSTTRTSYFSGAGTGTQSSTPSMSSATTLTSPGTSKGSWGDMMMSPPLPLHESPSRPLPIPQTQSSMKIDPVSTLFDTRRRLTSSPDSFPAMEYDQLPSLCQLLDVQSRRLPQGSKRSLSPLLSKTPSRAPFH
jgi:hypothetical protein